MASLDLAAPKLGSGKRFAKLSATLAARGAHDPDALAAWIGRRKFGAARMGKLSHGVTASNPDLGIYLAADGDAPKPSGGLLKCPACGHEGMGSEFGASGASQDRQPADLRTPAPGTGAVRDGVPLTVRGNAAHALANGSTRAAVELARAGTLTARRHPIHGPMDVLVARSADGTAVLRHRHGGATIASLRKTEDGKWVASVGGRDLAPRDHQRTALMEAVGTWNGAISGAVHPSSAPLQPPPQQTELMKEYGIPAIRALATPVAGAGDGPRMTTAAGGDDGTDENGLNAKGQGIYKRLLAKGLKPGVAMAFAKRSQNAKPGVFGKVSA